MTREDAIKVLRTESVEIGGNAVSVARWLTALDVAVKALEDDNHFREVTKKVEPLTLDELRKMDGEPVWVEFQDGSGGCWGLVHITVFTHIVFANGHFCTVGKPYYGKTWQAYRQKPEETDHVV